MKPNKDLLSPDSSPQKLNTAGVKRVNNLPLIIAISVLAIFVLLIAMVAYKRGNAQNQVAEPVKIAGAKKNTLSLANEIVGNYKAGVLPALTESQTVTPAIDLPQPLPKPQELEDQTVSDTEIERIRQEKAQEFEEAVKAKTAISVDNTHLNNKEQPRASLVNQDVTMNMDVASSFKAQLQALQQKQNARPVALNIGGEENEMRWHLNSRLENPNSRFELRAGSSIPAVMISGISSELPGQIIGQVSQNVFDTATGKYLLIPQGTKLVGIYSS